MDQFHDARTAFDLDRQLRVGVEHGAHPLEADQQAELQRHRHPQLTMRFAMHGLGDALGVFDRSQDADAALVDFAPHLGQAQAARRALEQADPELGLHVADLPADPCFLAAQQFGGAGETAALDDGDEGTVVAEIHRRGFDRLLSDWSTIRL